VSILQNIRSWQVTVFLSFTCLTSRLLLWDLQLNVQETYHNSSLTQFFIHDKCLHSYRCGLACAYAYAYLPS
jgi:hypothetical protein